MQLKEQDIQHMIQLNRVTKLMHKAQFKARQRRTIVEHSHRYVITVDDITKASKSNYGSLQTFGVDELLQGFDPQNNSIDRRLFYEVTGSKIIEDEFIDFGSI